MGFNCTTEHKSLEEMTIFPYVLDEGLSDCVVKLFVTQNLPGEGSEQAIPSAWM